MKTALATSAFLLCAAMAGAQENYALWSNHKDITVNTKASGANVATPVAGFPVLVRLTPANADVFAASQNGSSIRFANAAGARLPYQIDHWDATAQKAAIWVRADTVKGNDSTASIRMYFNRAGAFDSSNGTAVFANGFTNVWHLGDADTLAPRPNAVAGGNPATPVNFPAGYAPKNGLIGKADSLRGGPSGTGTTQPGQSSNTVNLDRLDLGSNNIDYSQGFTYSLWVLQSKDGINVNYYVASSDANGTGANTSAGATGLIVAGLITSTNGTGVKFRQRNAAGAGNVGILNNDATLGNNMAGNIGVWRHVLFTKGPGTAPMVVYRDGDSISASTAVIQPFASQARAQNWIGPSHPGLQYIDSGLAGLVDEARLANVGRGSAWARLEFQTQKANAGAVILGATQGAAIVTGPGAPTGVNAVAGNAQATVSWTAPASNGGSAITGYKAMAVSDTNKTCSTTGALTCPITGLANGQGYAFVVRAINSAGSSVLSDPSTPVTPAAPATVPGAPTGVTAVAGTAGSGQVSVTWVAPASTGGSAITGYKAVALPDTLKTCSTDGALTCNITGLTGGTEYTFAVRAINAVGAGERSTASAPVTPPVSLRPAAFALHVNGTGKPYSFRLTPAQMQSTESLELSISDVHGRTVWSKTVRPQRDRVQEIAWNGVSGTGLRASAGMYLVRIRAEGAGRSVDLVQQSIRLD